MAVVKKRGEEERKIDLKRANVVFSSRTERTQNELGQAAASNNCSSRVAQIAYSGY